MLLLKKKLKHVELFSFFPQKTVIIELVVAEMEKGDIKSPGESGGAVGIKKRQT